MPICLRRVLRPLQDTLRKAVSHRINSGKGQEPAGRKWRLMATSLRRYFGPCRCVSKNIPMFFQKHTYVFSKTYLCFFRNIPMIFQKHTYVFSKTYLWFFRNIPMIFQKHTYDFSKTYLWFFRNIPMIFQKHTCVFSETYLWFFGETGACFLGTSYVPENESGRAVEREGLSRQILATAL